MTIYKNQKYCCEDCATKGARLKLREYRRRNWDKTKRQLRESYYRNILARRAYMKKYNEEHKEEIREWHKKYYEEHKEAIKEKSRIRARERYWQKKAEREADVCMSASTAGADQ